MAGKWFEKCPEDVVKVMEDLISKYYGDLAEVKLKVDLLFVHAPSPKDGEEKAPALKHHGYQAAAIVKINSLEQRVKGAGDVTIIIDGDEWPHWSERRQQAVLHHEINHVVIKRDADGNVLSDDIGRPRVKLKLHDWELGGFACIAEKYGDDAPEKEAMNHVANEYRQLLFPWG